MDIWHRQDKIKRAEFTTKGYWVGPVVKGAAGPYNSYPWQQAELKWVCCTNCAMHQPTRILAICAGFLFWGLTAAAQKVADTLSLAIFIVPVLFVVIARITAGPSQGVTHKKVDHVFYHY
jgi:hypothetical protein